MRIGIDARPLVITSGGIPRVVRSIVSELAQLDPQNEYFFYSHRDFQLPLRMPNWRKRVEPLAHFLPGTLWLQAVAKRRILEDRIDVFWGTAHVLPLGLPSSVGKILTAHDLVWLKYPGTMSWYNRHVNSLLAEPSMRQADRIMAISESTARDLQMLAGIERSKVEVIYHGTSQAYRPRDRAAAGRYIATKFGVSEDFICAVGTLEPRKNLVTLLGAVRRLRDRRSWHHQLLVAGGRGWKESCIHQTVRRLGLFEHEVRFLGYVPEEDLPFLYSGAAVFVFPSIYEGFGLPLVEAMACGVPIVASDCSSTPEVVQGAALLVSPHQPEEFASAIARVIEDQELRVALVERGLKRARLFRWDTAARKVVRILTRDAA
jgi:glycosyltransferase involved in cell wall biosynthesis